MNGVGETQFVRHLFDQHAGVQEAVGRVSKLVYSYVKEVSNGYILAKKGALKPGDRLKIHGADCVITGRSWLG